LFGLNIITNTNFVREPFGVVGCREYKFIVGFQSVRISSLNSSLKIIDFRIVSIDSLLQITNCFVSFCEEMSVLRQDCVVLGCSFCLSRCEPIFGTGHHLVEERQRPGLEV